LNWDIANDAPEWTLLHGAIAKLAGNDCASWFAIWFPLRRNAVLGETAAICQGDQAFPGDFERGETCPPSLSCIFHHGAPSIGETLIFLNHVRAVTFDEHDQPRLAVTNNTETKMLSSGERYWCRRVIGSGEIVGVWRNKNAWPKVTKRTEDGGESQEPDKAAWDIGAAVSVRQTEDSQGHLRLFWSVFLPVGSQAAVDLPLCSLNRDVHIFLHGYFFLNSERTRVLGIEDCFKSASEETQEGICIAWNKALATSSDGLLPLVIPTLADCFEAEGFTAQVIAEIVAGLQKCVWFELYQEHICQKQFFGRIYGPNGWSWQKFDAGLISLVFPLLEYRDNEVEVHLANLLGSATSTLKRVVLVQKTAMLTAHALNATWNADDLEQFCGAVQRDALAAQPGARRYLSKLISCFDQLAKDHPKLWDSLPIYEVTPIGATLKVVSASDLRDYAKQGHLFTGGDTELKNCFKDTCPKAQAWFMVVGSVPPGVSSDHFDAKAAAKLVLEQTDLGKTHKRIALIAKLLAAAGDESVKSAIRFLIHGSADHHSAGGTIYLRLAENDSLAEWNKIIQSVLDHQKRTWQLVDAAFVPGINDDQKRTLDLRMCGADSFRSLCGGDNADSTNLPLAHYHDFLLTHLNEGTHSDPDADTKLLRKLKIHQYGENQFTAIGDNVWLAPEAGNQLPPELMRAWSDLCQNAKIVKRSTARNVPARQQELFKDRILNANGIIRLACKQEGPSRFAKLILHHLGPIGNPATETGNALRTASWLPLKDNKTSTLSNLLWLEGAEDPLEAIAQHRISGSTMITRGEIDLDFAKDSKAWNTLSAHLIAKGDDAIALLNSAFGGNAALHFGLSKLTTPDALEIWLRAVDGCEADISPVVPLVRALWPAEQDKEGEAKRAWAIRVAGVFTKEWSNALAMRYDTVLEALRNRHSRADADARSAIAHVFHDYLASAVRAGRWSECYRTEADFTLLNQEGAWTLISQLVVPINGLARRALADEHAVRALGLRHAVEAHTRLPGAIIEEADNEAELVTLLRNYGDALSETLPPKLWGIYVALLGGTPIVKALADELTGGRTDTIRDELCGPVGPGINPRDRVNSCQYSCTVTDGDTAEVAALNGDFFDAPLDLDHASFLVAQSDAGEGQWWLNRFFVNPSRDGSRFRFRLCDPASFAEATSAQMFDRLEKTVVQLLSEVLHVTGDQLGRIRTLMEKLLGLGQLSLGRAQQEIVATAQIHLSQLGIRPSPGSKLVDAMRRLDDATSLEAQAREERDNGIGDPDRHEKEAKTARDAGLRSLREVFQTDSDVHHMLSGSMKTRIGREQYQPTAIPFELFQNADDALAQMSTGSDATRIFVVDVHDEAVRFAHWGRPINHPADAEGELKRSYERDLLKMLILHGSDKQVDPNDATVTGKFGLGFKSVYLVTDNPKVISGDLAFDVAGAIYPRRLENEDNTRLRDCLQSLMPNQKHGTIIELPTGACSNTSFTERFVALAPYLAVFAREIKELRIRGEQERSCHWLPESVHAGNDWELWLGDAGRAGSLLHLRCGEVSWLFGLDAAGIKKVPDLPCLWATAPLHASGEVGFAINGPFDPDPGRTELGKGEAAERRNAEFLLQASTGLCDFLKWCACQDNVCGPLGLHAVPNVSFWKSLWTVFSSLPVAGKDASAKARVSKCVWPKDVDSGYAGAAKELPILPNGMPGALAVLTSIERVSFETSGFLESPSGQEFLKAAATWREWSEMEQGLRVTPDQIVSPEIAQSLRCHLGGEAFRTEKIAVPFIIRRLTGEADHITAHLSGELGLHLTPSIWNPDSDTDYDWHRSEKDDLREFLDALLFQNEADEWMNSKSLLIGTTSGNESLRAAIAPPERRLTPAYSDDAALNFFRLCRSEMEVSPQELADWIEQSLNERDDGRIVAALRLFASEDRIAEEVVRLLSEDRKSSILGTEQYCLLQFDEQHRINKLFEIATLQNEREAPAAVPPREPPPQPLPVLSVADLLSAWRECEALERFTLAGSLGTLVFPGSDPNGDDERRNCLLAVTDSDAAIRRDSLSAWYRLLCLGCSLSIPLGTTPIDRIQEFWTRSLSKHLYWEKTIPTDLANVNDDKAERALDPVFNEIIHAIFKDKNSSGEDAHFWRRVFYDFRKMRRLVFSNDFPRYLLKVAAHPETTGNDLVAFLKSGDVPTHLQDAGFEKWTGVIGQSMSGPLLFVMRELRLMGVLADDRFNSVCYYMNTPARRIATRLEWIDSEDRRSYDFESLLSISERVCVAMNEADEEKALIDFLDLPLQWYAHKNPR